MTRKERTSQSTTEGMAAAVARPIDISSSRSSTRSSTTPSPLTLNTSSRGTPAAIPNKHLAYSSPGRTPKYGPSAPLTPESPPPGDIGSRFASPLSPPDPNARLTQSPPVYALDAAALADAVEQLATQPLPDPNDVFPWLHGLHPENQIQVAFFAARKKSLRRIPKCLRSLTIIKAGPDLSCSKLKGAISAEELFSKTEDMEDLPSWVDADPKFGFSVRNFQIQACKLATISDLVVYGDDSTPRENVESLAKALSHAQQGWKRRLDPEDSGQFSTFLVTDPFSVFEDLHSEIVAIDSKGDFTGNVTDFFTQERIEMCTLSKASEIAPNVWLGPTPYMNGVSPDILNSEEARYDICIEACDYAKMPDEKALSAIEMTLRNGTKEQEAVVLEFPSSGSIAFPASAGVETEKILLMCQWIHKIASDGKIMNKETPMEVEEQGYKILIHCTDGYTESSLLALAYFMYTEGLSAHDAWIKLHCEKGRNFFAYPSDKMFLETAQTRLMQASPKAPKDGSIPPSPVSMERMDGSLPSRVLPYMYLGNLFHAQNPAMLRELGITQVLSIGEPIKWSNDEREMWGKDNFLYIDGVQDNGVDPLTHEFGNCLKFIGNLNVPFWNSVDMLTSIIRASKRTRSGYACTLSRWRIKIGHNLYSRSDE